MTTSSVFDNPYTDPQMREFWDMCVQRDIEAFLANDWSMTADDFDANDFFGVDAKDSHDPSEWRPTFTTLDEYQAAFASQASVFAATEFAEDPRHYMYKALTLGKPNITGDRATILKVFDGALPLKEGGEQRMAWQSLFFLKRSSERWRFTGFVGYLPLSVTAN